MDIVQRVTGDVTILELKGRLARGNGAELLRSSWNSLTGQGRVKLVLHLEAVSFVDSAALGEIIRGITAAKRAGGALKLVKPARCILSLVDITIGRWVLEIFDSEEAALKSFGSAGTV